MAVDAAKLDMYMGLDGAINTARADLVISLVNADAQAVVNPVPAEAEGILLSASARVYGNPQQVSAESVGPFSVNHPTPGAFLTRRERQRLRRMAGYGTGAYTVDPTPADVDVTATWPPLWSDDDNDVWTTT